MGASGPSRVSPLRLFDRARSAGGPIAILTTAVGGMIFAVFFGISDLIQSIFNFFSQPTFAAGGGAANVILAFLNGIATIIFTGARVSANALVPSISGVPWVIALFAFIIGILVVAGGVFVMSWLLNLQFTSDFIPGTGTDFPIVGDEGEAVLEDED